MTSGGREVDVGGAVPDYKYVRNKPESGFLTDQAEYSWSCERLGSCLATEHSMMKSSTLFYEFECGPLPPYVHLASTWRHSRDKCSQAFPVFRALPPPCIILNANRRTKKWGRPGNEATLCTLLGVFIILIIIRIAAKSYPNKAAMFCEEECVGKQSDKITRSGETEVAWHGIVEGLPVGDIVVDMGSSRTLVRCDLVSKEKMTGGEVSVRCAHGDIVS